MPTYEYDCNACNTRFELEQSMRDEPISKCPHCGGSVRRVFSLNSVIFKGSGFYSTDNGTKKPAESAPAPCGKEKAAACPSCPAST
jgi:putative FmdB family regulatory protein